MAFGKLQNFFSPFANSFFLSIAKFLKFSHLSCGSKVSMNLFAASAFNALLTCHLYSHALVDVKLYHISFSDDRLCVAM